VESIAEIAADTITMHKSTNPSCGSAVRFSIGGRGTSAAGSVAGALPADRFKLSRLLIVFQAAHRFVFHKLRSRAKPHAMRAVDLSPGFAIIRFECCDSTHSGAPRSHIGVFHPPVHSRKSALDPSPTHPNRRAV